MPDRRSLKQSMLLGHSLGYIQLYPTGGANPLNSLSDVKVPVDSLYLNPVIKYTANATEIIPSIFRVSDIFMLLLSWGNLMIPKRYKANPSEISIQIIKKGSILSSPQCFTKSALDKNLKASPNSRNPITTFTVFIQEPDRGSFCIMEGKAANRPKGRANANPNPDIPAVNCMAPPSELKDPASKDPRIGPVQEKETRANVSAIKNIPNIPPNPSALLTLLDHDEGKVNS